MAALREDWLAPLRKTFGDTPSQPFLALTEQEHPRAVAVDGYVQVRAQQDMAPSKQLPLSALRDDSLAKLKKSFEYTPSKPFLPLTEQDDPRGEAVKGWLGGFAGEAKGSDHGGDTAVAVRLGFIRRGGTTFSLIALSAPVRDDTLAAFRTQRAFEIARDTLELPNQP